MKRAGAREILGLREGCSDLSEIKRSYRSMSFELHPDRFVSPDSSTGSRSEDEIAADEGRYADVRVAYETLRSGVRDTGENSNGGGGGGRSWYESLGGQQRTEFYGPVELCAVDRAVQIVGELGCKSAVVGLAYDIVMNFAARNQAAAVGGGGGE